VRLYRLELDHELVLPALDGDQILLSALCIPTSDLSIIIKLRLNYFQFDMNHIVSGNVGNLSFAASVRAYVHLFYS